MSLCKSLSFALSSGADEEILVDVGDDSSTGNGSLDEEVEFLVSTDGQLKMSGSDSSHLEVLGSISSQLEDLSCEVLEDSSCVDCSS